MALVGIRMAALVTSNLYAQNYINSAIAAIAWNVDDLLYTTLGE